MRVSRQSQAKSESGLPFLRLTAELRTQTHSWTCSWSLRNPTCSETPRPWAWILVHFKRKKLNQFLTLYIWKHFYVTSLKQLKRLGFLLLSQETRSSSQQSQQPELQQLSNLPLFYFTKINESPHINPWEPLHLKVCDILPFLVLMC